MRRTAVDETTAPQAGSQAASTTDVREPARNGKGGNANKTGKAVAEESQTYEEAKEAFERSPRRRRPTRGNSRSDRAPRREDFESTKPKADAEGSKGGDRAKDNRDDSNRSTNRSANRSGGGRRSGKSRVEVVAVQGTGARRNRRRAVRRVSSQSDAGATAPKQRQGASNRATKPEQKQANRGAAAPETKPANRRRRVRRAVRRSGQN